MSQKHEEFDGARPTSPSAINNIIDFDRCLPLLCEEVIRHLGAQNLESTYQKALKYELHQFGVEVLSEVKLNVMYKDIVVGTRRADLVLKLKDSTKIVIELKAVKHLSGDNMEQLYYYMAHLRCNVGYLINFPHETGFPGVLTVGIVTGNHVNVFVNNCVYGNGIESIRICNESNGKANEEINLSPVLYKAVNTTILDTLVMEESDLTSELVCEIAKLDITKPSGNKTVVKGGKPVVQNAGIGPKFMGPIVKGPVTHSAINSTVFIAPIASSTKQPCKFCINKGMHRGGIIGVFSYILL